MIVLGICDSMTSGAAIIDNGKVIAAVSEERLTRQKMAMGFPLNSISEVLKIGSIEMKDVDHVAVATNNLFWRPESVKYEDYFRKPKGSMRDMYLSLGSFFARVTGGSQFSQRVYYDLKSFLTRKRRKMVGEVLRERWGYKKGISFVDHHVAHCASAYFTSGMSNATVISLDGAGDGCSSHVYHVEDGKFTLLNKIDSYDSIGNYYAYVTHLCGFQAHKHEGKITGLAAYGKNGYVNMFRRYVAYSDGGIKNLGKCFDWSAIKKIQREIGSEFDKADLAASVQTVLEETVTDYIDYWTKKSGKTDLAIAGGVFANVKLNQRIHGLDSVEKIFIHPGMGDEGLAVGAALLKSFELCKKENVPFEPTVIKNVYLGSEFTDSEIQRAIEASNLSYERVIDIEKKVAELLAAGKIVARFSGRMEYGPRALGNRSILYQPTDITVNDWLNKRLQRTEFMPFAPVTLREYADMCYKNMAGAEEAARFMTITFNCTDWMKESCPSVVHIDGTARPQIIDKYREPGYYRIVDEYRKLTGLPSIINTSFNMHEEPIVCTPEDAIRAFKEGHLDYLALENFLLTNNGKT
jgi:carbamoyltransferase